ncbi:MAG: helix-turn-helix transcriptional regulator [Bacilli bacterium]|nr:helix-turn-helix transcriptional regulator [Bacilli bacterium]MBP3921284.1 helix-turn-helix transcriptional regulator [Bacilli bacterium]
MKTSNIRKVLGANIKYYRFIIGYTQEQLAEKCDMSPRYISDIENSKGNIPVDTLEKLAKYLKVEPYLLIKEQKPHTLPKRVNMK